MIELSRTQDESVGDGTTSVVILAGEAMQLAEPLLTLNTHPTTIISGYRRALDDALESLKAHKASVDLQDRTQVERVIASCLGTKFVSRWGDLMVKIAYDAVNIVSGGRLSAAPSTMDVEGATATTAAAEIDLKKYARVEKIPGGDISDSQVIRGVVLNKDVTHAKMRRHIENPRIVLLDCNLEYKKAESQTNVECASTEDFEKLLKEEETEVKKMCDAILRVKPDVVCTEKGLSDIAQHYLLQGGVTALRRLRKTDNNRLARISGATIAHRPEELRDQDVGTRLALFDVRKIGDEYFTFMTAKEDDEKVNNEKVNDEKVNGEKVTGEGCACTILLRGPTKDVMNEVERNLWDAMAVARNIALDPVLVPGGGAIEMAVANDLSQRAAGVKGLEQVAYKNIAIALEVIPRTLAQNCGADVVRTITELRAKHAQDPEGNWAWGIDGLSGKIADMHVTGVWEPYEVKAQTFKSAVEAACLLLRVDDILSGVSKNPSASQSQQARNPELAEPGLAGGGAGMMV